jgi:hypothetical protein
MCKAVAKPDALALDVQAPTAQATIPKMFSGRGLALYRMAIIGALEGMFI